MAAQQMEDINNDCTDGKPRRSSTCRRSCATTSLTYGSIGNGEVRVDRHTPESTAVPAARQGRRMDRG
eukprot:8555278-Heterocapsa_arctica.AAC.1